MGPSPHLMEQTRTAYILIMTLTMGVRKKITGMSIVSVTGHQQFHMLPLDGHIHEEKTFVNVLGF